MDSNDDSEKQKRKDSMLNESSDEIDAQVLSEKMIPRDIIDVITEEVTSKRIVDTQTYISETQARVWKALKRGL